MANPYQQPGFKDPRQSAQESASTLSSYFQDQAAKQPKTVSPYSVPAEPVGMPAGGGSAGGPSAPSAPKGSAGGGTGFVSFGQYFGGNAPAIQQQAQGVVGKATAPKAPNAPAGATGLGMARPASFGPAPTSGQMIQRQPAGPSAKDPYAAQIAQTSAQFAALNPAAPSGDMGENVSAFDQLLGGGVTQRAAKQEQQRLGTLRSTLEGEQAQYRQEQQAAAQAKSEADRQAKQQAEWQAWWDNERRRAEYAEQQKKAEDEASFWDIFKIGSLR